VEGVRVGVEREREKGGEEGEGEASTGHCPIVPAIVSLLLLPHCCPLCVVSLSVGLKG